MEAIELVAVALTVASVLLAVHRSLWQFPVGILATLTYAFVFWRANLYASVCLNIFFSLVQVYGWWFWVRGEAGVAPRVTSWPWTRVAVVCAAAGAGAFLLALGLRNATDAAVPFADAGIFGLSVAAQFLLSRKVIQTWPVWGAVNLLSVGTYASQGLWPTTALYAALFLNVFWGAHEWRKAMHTQAAAS